jgi:hypothetical protein
MIETAPRKETVGNYVRDLGASLSDHVALCRFAFIMFEQSAKRLMAGDFAKLNGAR